MYFLYYMKKKLYLKIREELFVCDVYMSQNIYLNVDIYGVYARMKV